MGLISHMKNQIAKSGSNKKEILYFAENTIKRVRFLQELDNGFEFQFHNDWDTKIFELCKDPEDHENCKLCNDGISIQENFVWSVWDYDSNSVKLIQFKASGVSPIPALIEMYEEYGTIMDRDYKIKKIGKGQGSSFSVTPLDKERFSNKKAKALNKMQVKEILEKAWTSNSVENVEDDEDGDEEEVIEKKAKKKKAKKVKTIQDKLMDCDISDIKEIAKLLGMSKKELKQFDDEEELIEELTDNFEDDDISDCYEEYFEDEDEEE